MLDRYLIFQRFLRCIGQCSSAIEERERVCSSNPNCLLLLSYLCFNESACVDGCSGTCPGKWIPTENGLCSARYCDGGTRTVKFTCKDQGKLIDIN